MIAHRSERSDRRAQHFLGVEGLTTPNCLEIFKELYFQLLNNILKLYGLFVKYFLFYAIIWKRPVLKKNWFGTCYIIKDKKGKHYTYVGTKHIRRML